MAGHTLSKPSCVLLDLDNTLYPYAPSHIAGLKAVREMVQSTLKVSEQDFDICLEQAKSQIKSRLGQTASSHSRLLYFQRVLELLGLGSQPANALMLEKVYWREFLSKAELLPEAEDFLDDLRIAGVPIVIVTDLTASIQMRKMIYFDLGRFIDFLVTSEESGEDKPHAAMFNLALAKLGGVEGPIWMIGDSYEKDIVGAKTALQATTFLRKSKDLKQKKSELEQADVMFSHFSEMRKLFQKTL